MRKRVEEEGENLCLYVRVGVQGTSRKTAKHKGGGGWTTKERERAMPPGA